MREGKKRIEFDITLSPTNARDEREIKRKRGEMKELKERKEGTHCHCQ
jgi:hypothetical protein